MTKSTSGKTGVSLARHKSRQDIGTPPEFIEAIARRFGPVVFDLAANSDNAVCEDYYGPGSICENSLVVPWSFNGRARLGNWYLNPPFANIAPWAEKCSHYWERRGFLFLLVPSARGSNWFQQHVKSFAQVMDLTDRIQFVGQSCKYPKDLLLAVYGFGFVGNSAWHWDWNVRKAYDPKASAAPAAGGAET
jgi:phage N-6-adenine-methyltransferase